MTLRLRIGKKGYIILPKAVREAVSVNEGDEATVEVGDGIVLKPIQKFNKEAHHIALKRHLDRITNMLGLVEPQPSELSRASLEEGFESQHGAEPGQPQETIHQPALSSFLAREDTRLVGEYL